MTECGHCGKPLPPNRGTRERKWCSERCRRRQYDLTCSQCGGRVDGRSPGKIPDLNEPVCAKCAPGFYTVWTREAIVLAIQEWADEHGGIPPAAKDFQRAHVTDRNVPAMSHVQWRFGKWNDAIRAAGYEPHLSGPVGGFTALTTAQRAECARRYANGESSVQIAADLGCAPHIVLKWARRAGVPIRPPFARAA